jgi:hypothetical protein
VDQSTQWGCAATGQIGCCTAEWLRSIDNAFRQGRREAALSRFPMTAHAMPDSRHFPPPWRADKMPGGGYVAHHDQN